MLVVKNLPSSAGDGRAGVQSLGREELAGGGNGSPFQYSCSEFPVDRGAWLGYSSWGGKESDMTECLTTPQRSYVLGLIFP